jgi:hypothetical protein
MIDPQRYQADPVVSCRDEGDDGAILFNPDTDDTAVLNPSGRALWAQLAQPCTADELAAHLTATYEGVTPEQAAQDVAAFLQQLGGGFLIETGTA